MSPPTGQDNPNRSGKRPRQVRKGPPIRQANSPNRSGIPPSTPLETVGFCPLNLNPLESENLPLQAAALFERGFQETGRSRGPNSIPRIHSSNRKIIANQPPTVDCADLVYMLYSDYGNHPSIRCSADRTGPQRYLARPLWQGLLPSSRRSSCFAFNYTWPQSRTLPLFCRLHTKRDNRSVTGSAVKSTDLGTGQRACQTNKRHDLVMSGPMGLRTSNPWHSCRALPCKAWPFAFDGRPVRARRHYVRGRPQTPFTRTFAPYDPKRPAPSLIADLPGNRWSQMHVPRCRQANIGRSAAKRGTSWSTS